MQHVRRVDVLEAAQDLIDKVLDVLVRQRLRRHDDPGPQGPQGPQGEGGRVDIEMTCRA